MDKEKVDITLPGGSRVVGVCENGLVRVRGFKYAEAKRFRAPTPVSDTCHGSVDCTSPAPICPQNPSRLNRVTGDLNRKQPMHEDCLNLSITTPVQFLREKNKSSLPVMVWFHGGAFMSGGGDLDCYWPQGLAARNIVTVNVTYRLGIFGGLPVDGNVAPANLFLLDQIEALRWVQRNISAFGGDPGRVTVVGQSSGGMSVVCLMVTEQSNGLFQRAIIQSSPLGMPIDIPNGRQLSAFAKSELPQDPYAASTDELLRVQTRVVVEAKRLGIPRPFWPRFGEYPLPEVSSNLEHLVSRKARQVPILMSWMLDEATAFLPMIDWYAYYIKMPLVGPLFNALFNRSYSDKIFIGPAKRLHNAYRQAGGSSSTCCFRFRPQGSSLGATHCLDLPYLFGLPVDWKDSPMVHGAGSLDVIQRVGEDVKNVWAAFISGDALKPSHYDVDRTVSSWQF